METTNEGAIFARGADGRGEQSGFAHSTGECHIMLDIETLGVDPDAVITEIGAVVFDERGASQNTIERLWIPVDVFGQLKMGRAVDRETVAWWKDQDADKFASFFNSSGRVPVDRALDELACFLGTFAYITIWCNGASFDFGILINVAHAVGKRVNWRYSCERDYRTIRGLFPDEPKAVPNHSALQDSISQANALARWFRMLERKIG